MELMRGMGDRVFIIPSSWILMLSFNRLAVDPSMAKAAAEEIMPHGQEVDVESHGAGEAMNLIYYVISQAMGSNPVPYIPLPYGGESEAIPALYATLVNSALRRASEIINELTRPCFEGDEEACVRGVEKAALFHKYSPALPSEIARILMGVAAVGAMIPQNRLGEARAYGNIPIINEEKKGKEEKKGEGGEKNE